MGVNPALGVMIAIFFILVGLTLFYYGRKAIISRKAEYNDGLTKTEVTGRWAVLIGIFMLGAGTAALAGGILFGVGLFLF